MASTIAVSCPKCENQIKVPPELAGKSIRCKECLHVFKVKAPPGVKAEKGAKGVKPAKAEAEPAEVDDTTADANPYDVRDHDFLPRCPYCAKELETEDQVICLNCGYNRRTRERIHTAKTLEPTGGEWFIHLLPGIICALFALSNITGIVFTWVNRKENFAAYGPDDTFNPYGFGFAIWRTVIGLFLVFLFGRFAIKRLILHPRPPERAMATKKK